MPFNASSFLTGATQNVRKVLTRSSFGVATSLAAVAALSMVMWAVLSVITVHHRQAKSSMAGNPVAVQLQEPPPAPSVTTHAQPPTPNSAKANPLKITLSPGRAITPRAKSRVTAPFSDSNSVSDSRVRPAAPAKSAALASYSNIPMSFEANRGQSDPSVLYQVNGHGYKLALENLGATLSVAVPDENKRPESAVTVKDRTHLKPVPRTVHYSSLGMRFVGANPAAEARGLKLLPGISNYFLSSDVKSWFTNIPTYSQVQYTGLYPGVDLLYYGNQHQLEYDFVVAPGADPNVIVLQLSGSREQHIDSDGSLVVDIAGQKLRFQKPVVYQSDVRGERNYIDGSYRLQASSNNSSNSPELRFRLGSYDRERQLVIDPVLYYSEYASAFSGTVDAFAVDAAGAAYIASANNYSNMTVTKLRADGTTVVYNTVLGTSGVTAFPSAMTTDSSGKVYLTGWAGSTYPTTANAFQQTYTSNYQDQPFATVLDPTGSTLVYSTFLAGTINYDYGYGVGIDSAGKVYIAGQANASDFPTTSGAFQTTFTSASSAVFVAKIDPTLSGTASLIYSTLINPANSAAANGLAIDSNGNAYITGQMDAGFPITPGAFVSDGEGTSNGGAFVTKLNTSGSNLVYSAFLGAGSGTGIAVDGAGSAYVTGTPTYTDFPTTTGAYQTSYPGGFVSKLSPDGSGLVYSTFLSGPSLQSTPQSIALVPGCASTCSAYVAGYTQATDFPVINAIQNFSGGSFDDFLVQLSGDGSAATLSTYVGGSGNESYGYGTVGDPHVAVDASGNISLAGSTGSSDFPVTLSSASSSAFILKIAPSNASTVVAVPNSLNFSYQGVGISSASQNILVRNMGSTAMAISSVAITGDFSETDNCSGGIPGGGSCSISTAFKPTASGTRVGTITITGSANNSPTVINLQGSGQDGGDIILAPTSLSFAPQMVGTNSTSQAVTISNGGDQPLSNYGLYFNSQTGFTETDNCPGVLAAGANCTANIVFAPTQPGLASSAFYVSNTGLGYGSSYVTLTGSGIVGSDAMLTLSATALTFPATVVGSSAPTQSMYLTSTGSTPVNISNISISGDFFFQSNGCSPGTNNNPGNTCYIYIGFKPTATGTRTGAVTITDNTGSSPHALSLSGTGVAASPTLVITPASINFGNQLVGSASAVQSVSIYNTGNSPVTINRFEDTLEFPVANEYYNSYYNSCSTIAVGSYCNLYVEFIPSTAGLRSANITIVDNAVGSPQTVAVSGMGYSSSAGPLVPTATSITFDPQGLNTTSQAQIFNVYNAGNVPVNINSVTATGDFAINYTSCLGSLAGSLYGSQNGGENGNYCTIYVNFTPTAIGARTGTVLISSSNTTTPYSVSLNGTGLAATSNLTPSITSLTYGPQVVNTQSADQVVYVYNTGSTNVSMSSVTSSGDFSIDYQGCTGTLDASGGSCQINVNFDPTQVGARTGAITITSSDPGSPYTITLNGTGVASVSGLTPTVTGLTFGPQAMNTTSGDQYFVVYNTGDVPVTVSSITASGDFAVDTSSTSCPSISTSTSCQIYVNFTPSATGMRSGTLSIASSASTTPSVINLNGTGVTATQTLLFIPATMSFGGVVTNTTSPYQQIMIYNSGSEPVTFSAPSATSSPFTIYSDGCGTSTLTPGNTCSIYVTFTPSAAGLQSGTLTLFSNATNTPQTVGLTGTGVSSAPGITFSPTTLSFAPQPVGTSSDTAYVGILFGGSGPITISSAVTSGDFGITTDNCGSSQNGGNTCNYYIAFTPTATGNRSGTLTVTDSQSGSPFTLSLDGFGFIPTSSLISSPSGLVFPASPVGVPYTGTYLLATVTNTGNVTVTGMNPSISGANASDFSFYYQTCNSTLSAGASCQLYVSFTPGATGSRSATVTVSSAGNTPLTVNLSGTGLTDTSTLIASPTSLVFTPTPQGTSYSGTYLSSTVTNTGNVDINGLSATIGGSNASDFSFYYQNTCPTTLSAGNSCTIYVTFNPTATGTRKATVTVSATGVSPVTINLSGTGQADSNTMVASPTALTFPNQPVGTTYSNLTSTVTNTGNVNVTGVTPAFGGTNAGDFSLYTLNCANPATLNPTGSCTYYVNFTPSAKGQRTATLTVTSSGNPVTINLSGNGITAASTLALSTTALVFPGTQQGTTFNYLTVTATNTGNSDVTNILGAINGTNPGDFSLYSTNCSSLLQPGTSCVLNVSFTPTTTGVRKATLTVTSSATTSPQSVSLSGNGLPAAGTAVISPTSVNVGPQTVGTTLTNATSIGLYATGSVPVTVSALNITGNFGISSDGCTNVTVPPGNSCVVYISFTPATSGPLTGSLTFTDNSTAKTHTASLAGAGLTTAQAIQLSQTTVNFGNQPIGVPSTPQVVYYANQGSSAVQITGVTVTGDYSLSGSNCVATTSVAQASYCTFSITFTPSATGTRSGTITITDTATGSPRKITLNGTGVSPYPIVDFVPSSLAFASQNVGSTSPAQSLTLTNTGTAALTFSAPPTVSGDFNLTSNGCTSPLPAKSSCSFSVVFAPTATGTRSGQLSFASNASTSPNVVALTGTGAAVGPVATISPSSLTFATQTVGSTSSAQSVTLQNTGNATMNITSVVASGDFAVTNNCNGSLAVNASCQISVTFTPSVTGTRTGTLTFTDNAPGSQVVNLSGTGAAAPAAVSLNPTSLLFSSQTISISSAPQTVTLTNTGTGTLNITSITASGDYAQTNNCGSSLGAASACSISVTFTPTAAGTRTGAVSITDNASGSPQKVTLSGTGTAAPLVTPSPSSLTFNNVNVGASSSPQTITVTNTGSASLTISSISVSSVGPNFTQTNTCTSALAINGTCTISVTFSPTYEGAIGGTISITDNAYNSPQTIGLSGTGVGSVGGLSTGALTFGNQGLGTSSAAQAVTLSSEGNAPLTGIVISTTGDFSQTNNCTTSLAANSNCTISVTFTPTTAGTRNGTLSVTDNAYGGGSQTASLTGTGTGAVLSLSPTSLAFGTHTNGTSTAQNLTVTNTGNLAMSFSSIQSTLGDYTYSTNCPASIAPNTPCTITVTFTPAAVGSRNGNLILTDNAPGSPQSVALTGTGTGASAVSFSPTSVVFPAQAIGTSSNATSVTLTNSGTATLNISTVTITGDFSDLNNCANTAVQAGSSCTIAVTFTPTAVGTRGGTVTITDDASTSPQTVSLSGTGSGVPAIQLTPTTLTFASQSLGTKSTGQTVTIKNSGTAALTISSISTTGDYTQTNTCPALSSSLAVGATCTVSVVFGPTGTGARPGSLSIADNAAGSPQSVSITGTGVAASLVSIAVTPNSISVPKGQSQQFTATGTYSDGTTQNLTSSATWSSSLTTVATVSASGLANVVGVGTTNITAASGGVTSTAAVLTGTQAVLQSIAITPATATVAKGQTQQFSATGTYSDGTTQNLTGTVTWSSSNTGVGTINAAGLATVSGVGSTNITAVNGTATSNTATLTGTAATLQLIAVTPASPSIAKGTTQQFVATGSYSDGSTQNLTNTATWSSATTSVATINSTGLATAVATGSSVIKATSAAVSGTATLTVTPATLVSISVTPALASVAKGQTQQFTATGTYSDSSTQNLSSTATWNSSNVAVATINSAGLASVVGIGSSNITAAVGNVTSNIATLTGTTAVLQSIAVTPASPSIAKGATQQFTATGTYSDGTTQNLTSTATWSSATPSVATITAGGLATAVNNGSSTISATSGAITGSTVLTVMPATLQSIAVTPAAPSIAKGTTQQFVATGTYSDGTSQNLTSSAAWSSATTSVATITAGGLASALSTGTSTISATSGAITGATVLTVTSPTLQSIAVTPANPSISKGGTQQFTATGTYSDSSTQNLTSTATWSSATPSVATITAGGLANGVATGTSIVSATSGSVTGSTLLTVTAPTLQSIAITPANPSISKGATQQFTATGKYSDGSTQNLTSTATWSSATPSVATITAGGLASGVATGTSTINATSGAITGSTVLTITAPTLQSIAVTPANPSISKGATQQFTATGTYSDGTTQNLTGTATWSSSTTTVASITPGGLATAVNNGTSTITATSGAITGSTVLTVTQATLQSIAVTPANPSVAKGASQQFTATGTYSDGTTQNLTGSATWSSATTSVATITAGGLANALGAGTSTISATSNGITGSTVLTVTPATLQSIAVSPASPSIAKGTTQQFTATGTYSDGTTQNLTGTATWSSAATSVATINSTGLATAVATGSSVIKATSAAVSGTATLTVTPATLVSISVTPASTSVAKGQTQQFTATGTYSDSSTQNLSSTATWNSSNVAVATINSAGLASVVGIGSSNITAAVGNVTSNIATLTGTTAVLQSIAVTPASPSIAKGATQQFTATGTYSDGTTQNLTSTATWSSATPSVATITAGGLATAVNNGSSTISATSGAITGSTVLTVTAATLQSIVVTPTVPSIAKGTTQQFTATGTYSDGTSQNLTSSAAWSSATTSVATITAGGLASALSTGTSTISATSGAITGSTVLTVTSPTLQSIAVTPASPSITKGGTQQFTAAGNYSDGSTQNLTGSVLWSSGTPSVATITSGGLASATATGSTNISATLSSISGSTVLTVTSPTLQSIVVTPANPALLYGGSQSFTATGTYSDASTQNLTNAVTWTSSLPSVATISSAGLATGVGSGSTQIVASLGAIMGATMLTIAPPATPQLLVSPTSVSFPTQLVGTTSVVSVLTLQNVGGATLNVGAISLAGPNAAEFAISTAVQPGMTNCPSTSFTLTPGANCAVPLTFAPLAIGTRTANLAFTDNQNGVAGTPVSVTLSGTGAAQPPMTTTVPVSFTPGDYATGSVPFNCPSGTVPCTDSNAHSLKLTITKVITPFTLTVTAYEVPLTEANGICEAGQTEATDFDCRFKDNFAIQTLPNGDTVVPQCNAFSNGNCVYYRISNVPPTSAYQGPVTEYFAWNNGAYVPPPIYAANNPRLYDDPDSPPYDVNHQFVFDITSYFNSGGGQVGLDPGISGKTLQFNDFVVGFPAALPNPPYTVAFSSPTSASIAQGVAMPVTFTITQGTTPITNALVAPNAVSLGVLNSAGVRQIVTAPDGTSPVFVFNPTTNTYSTIVSTQGFAPGTYQLAVNSNLFVQQLVTFTIVADFVTLSPGPPTLSLDGSGNYVVTFNVNNQGVPATLQLVNAGAVTAANSTPIAPLTALPISASYPAKFTLVYPKSLGAPGTVAIIRLSNEPFTATYANGSVVNGTWGGSIRIVLP